MREQQHIPNRRRIGQQHDQAVNTNTLARRRRQTVFQRTNVVGIKVHGLIVACVLFRHLLHEAFGLVFGIVQLGEAIRNLAPANEKLKTVRHHRIRIIAPCQWRNFRRVLGNKRRIFQKMFGGVLKNLNLHLAQAVAVFELDTQLGGKRSPYRAST